jgi:hypothetical protein
MPAFHIWPLLFIKCMSGMANRNLLYVEKLAIVTLSPPPSQRMDLSLLFILSGLFFAQFPAAQRKNPLSIPMRVSLSSRFPAHRPGFCERIMKPNGWAVYMQRNIIMNKKKPAGLVIAGVSPVLEEWRRQIHGTATGFQRKSVKGLIVCRTSLSLINLLPRNSVVCCGSRDSHNCRA